MKYFHKIASNVNVGPLAAKLARNPQWWTEDTYLRTFPQGPFGDTDSIICRFPPRPVPKTEEEKEEYLRTTDQHECVDQPIYHQLPEVRDLVMNLMAYVRGVRLGRVLVNRVMPGGRVFKHADTLDHCTYYSRFHICLQSAPGVVFTAGDEQVWMAPGEAYWFDNGRLPDRPEHEIINNSATERIHLVVDIKCD